MSGLAERMVLAGLAGALLERAQLADLRLLFDARLVPIGVGAAVVEGVVPPRLAVPIVAEGTPAAPIECK